MRGAFVIQLHQTESGEHYDLMFAQDASLATFQLAEPLWRLDVGGVWSVRRLPDHRLRYLQYEGPISGDRGRVRIVDRGSYALSGCWRRGRVRLAGDRSAGVFEILAGQGDQVQLRRV